MQYGSEFSVNAIKEKVFNVCKNNLTLTELLKNNYVDFTIIKLYPNPATNESGSWFAFTYNSNTYYITISQNNYTGTLWVVCNDPAGRLLFQKNQPNASVENLLWGYGFEGLGLAYNLQNNTYYLYSYSKLNVDGAL